VQHWPIGKTGEMRRHSGIQDSYLVAKLLRAFTGQLKRRFAVVSQSEAFDLFRRWQDNRTHLRVDANFPGVSRLSIETVIARVEEPLIGVDLADHGYIELLFVENWRFEFGAHDAMRKLLSDRVGASSSRLKAYEFGEIIAASKTNHTYILFLEIVRTVK
jgi:hypothetical protein